MSRKTTSLYHPFFTEEERRDLELVPHDDLTGEIFLQRYLLVMVMSKSPPAPLDFDLLLEKTRACNTAIRSLISLIYAHLEIQKGKQPWWEQLLDEARELACEQLGFSNYLSFSQPVPDNGTGAVQSDDPVLRRSNEMEATFDTPEDQPLPPKGPEVGRDSLPQERSVWGIPPKDPEVGQDTILPYTAGTE